MTSWWSQRNRRERQILLLGSALLVAVLGWIVVWEPLRDGRDAARVEYERQQAELAWMRPAVADARARGGVDAGAPAADGRSLLARVDAGLREAGLGPSLVAVEPQGERLVSARLSGTDFNRFSGWLEGQLRAGLVLDALSVQRATHGVDVRVDLREGGG